jgi:excisionase family DNA binding protein
VTTTQHLLPIGMDRAEGGPPEGSARAALGGVSRTTIYDLINRGELAHVNIGRRGFITAASIDAYIERLTAATQKVSA